MDFAPSDETSQRGLMSTCGAWSVSFKRPLRELRGLNTGQLPRAIPRECWLAGARFAFGSSDKSAIHVTNEELAVGRMLPCDSGLLKYCSTSVHHWGGTSPM